MCSSIRVPDPVALKVAVDQADGSWSYDGDDTLYCHNDVVDMRDLPLLSVFAEFIDSGYVQLSSDGNICRYIFVEGIAKKQIPQWVDA